MLLAGGLAVSATLLGVPESSSRAAPSPSFAEAGTAAASSTFPRPMWTDRVGTNTGFTSPTFATIDGVRAIVAASLDGDVYVVNAITGSALPGWPQKAVMTGSSATAIESSPAVAYLDGPSQPPTIIVGTGSQSVPYQNGGVIAFYATGQVRFVFHTKDTFAQWSNAHNDNSVFATPAVGDIQGNGEQDIVFGSYDHFIYALTPAGRVVPGFPIQRADTIWSSPALVDSSRTGRDDIIMGGDSTGFKSAQGQACYGGWVTDYRYSSSARTPRLIWERCLGQTVWSSPAIGVINSSGEPAVVVGTSFNHPYASNPATNEIFAFYVDNGNTVPGWPVRASGPTFGSPVIGQMTFGGAPVVISTSCAQCLHGPAVVSEWNGSGRRLWSTDVSSKYQMLASPTVVNVSGNASNDVLVGSNPGVALLNGSTGQFLYNSGSSATDIGSYCSVNDSAAASPVAGPGAPASGWELAFACTKGGVAYLYAYPLPGVPNQTPPSRSGAPTRPRTGIADPPTGGKLTCSPVATTSGYRLVRADGKELPVGNLGNCGALGTQVIPSPAAGEASTPDGGGYWIALSDGKVYAFGDAKWAGDADTANWTGGSVPPGAPIVGIAAAGGDSGGYYLLDGEGDVYAFGAAYYGGATSPNGAAVAIVADPQGGGYWIVTADGNAYGYGAAAHLGQAPGVSHVVGAAPADPTGNGLWLVSVNGTIHPLGEPIATLLGQPAADNEPKTPMVGIVAAPGDTGYYMVEQNATVYAFPAALHPQTAVAAQPEPVTAISAP